MRSDESETKNTSRPSHMPEYGIADAKRGNGLLPWSWAKNRLSAARYFTGNPAWLGGARVSLAE